MSEGNIFEWKRKELRRFISLREPSFDDVEEWIDCAGEEGDIRGVSAGVDEDGEKSHQDNGGGGGSGWGRRGGGGRGR